MMLCVKLFIVAALFPNIAFGIKLIAVVNQCPTSIGLFINHVWNGDILESHSTTHGVQAADDAFVTLAATANNGTTVGFHFVNGQYFIQKNSQFADVGVTVVPSVPQMPNGLCQAVTCNDPATCTTAFTATPTLNNTVPTSAPQAPLFACPAASSFNVTFCPSGTQEDGGTIPRQIHPMNTPTKCIDVRGNIQSNGTPVQVFDCNGTGAQKWLISKGNTQVKLAGTNFCLDAGSNPANSVTMKIWQCFPGLVQQSWFLTDDQRIAVTNRGLCLDVINGNLSNSLPLQTFQCTDNDQNQVFTS